MTLEKDILICDCGSPEHQIMFIYSDDDNYPIVYAEFHLNKKPFFKRILIGLRYILGYQSKYGAFDEFIITPSDINKFEKIVNYLSKTKQTI